MLFTLTQVLAQAGAESAPSYFPWAWVAMSLLAAGGVAWLVATVLGFARARVFGASARWFALSAVCLLVYHVQWLVFAVYGVGERNPANVLNMAAFFNLFVALGGLCAVIGFARLTNPAP